MEHLEEDEVPVFKPKEGEKILCYHGDKIFEAKCIKLKMTDFGPEYRIRFIGWGRRWDQWIGEWEKRILEHNAANLKKKDALETQQIIEQRVRRARLFSPDEAESSRSRGRTPKGKSNRKRERPSGSASSSKRRPSESASSSKSRPSGSPSSSKKRPSGSASSSKKRPSKSASSSKGRPSESASSSKGRPSESASSSKRRPSESASSSKGRPSESASSSEERPSRSASSSKRRPSGTALGTYAAASSSSKETRNDTTAKRGRPPGRRSSSKRPPSGSASSLKRRRFFTALGRYVRQPSTSSNHANETANVRKKQHNKTPHESVEECISLLKRGFIRSEMQSSTLQEESGDAEDESADSSISDADADRADAPLQQRAQSDTETASETENHASSSKKRPSESASSSKRRPSGTALGTHAAASSSSKETRNDTTAKRGRPPGRRSSSKGPPSGSASSLKRRRFFTALGKYVRQPSTSSNHAKETANVRKKQHDKTPHKSVEKCISLMKRGFIRSEMQSSTLQEKSGDAEDESADISISDADADRADAPVQQRAQSDTETASETENPDAPIKIPSPKKSSSSSDSDDPSSDSSDSDAPKPESIIVLSDTEDVISSPKPDAQNKPPSSKISKSSSSEPPAEMNKSQSDTESVIVLSDTEDVISSPRSPKRVALTEPRLLVKDFYSYNILPEESKVKLFELPEEIKRLLIDDKNFLHHENKLYRIFARPTADRIFKDFKCLLAGEDRKKQIAVMERLQAIFDKALGKFLLYDLERDQYENVCYGYQGFNASEIYGGPYILRLLRVLQDFDMNNYTADPFFITVLESFMNFLIQNSASFFAVENYKDYVKRV